MGGANFCYRLDAHAGEIVELAEKYRIEPKEMVCVDIGNPHLVIFSKLADKDKKILAKFAEK